MSDVLHVTRPEAGICELRMDDAANRNGLSEALVRALMTAFASLATDPGVKVVLLKGRADVFCAGATLESLRDVAHDRVRVKDVELPAAVVGCPVPVVAAIEGHAVGGGLALALCCDIQVAAEESRYGTNFAELGFTPGMGTTTLLPLAVGHGRASEMMMTARFYKGREMAGTGLFTHVVRRADVAASGARHRPEHRPEGPRRHRAPQGHVGRAEAGRASAGDLSRASHASDLFPAARDTEGDRRKLPGGQRSTGRRGRGRQLEKAEIRDVVLKHVRENVDGLEGVDIDTRKSMADYSASSLDIVEVVSASMRELQISIPRTRLSDVKNIDELVDLFDQVKHQV